MIIMGWDFSRFSDVIFCSALLVFVSFLSLEVKRWWAVELGTESCCSHTLVLQGKQFLFNWLKLSSQWSYIGQLQNVALVDVDT